MRSRNPSGHLWRAAFGAALTALGLGLEIARRHSARFRAQLAHPRTVQIGSADGVCHHYAFSSGGVSSRSGAAEGSDVSLCFDNARLGLKTLLSPHAVGRIVHALLERDAEYHGNAVLVLWFFALTRYVLPVGRTAAQPQALPGAYVEHDPHSRVATRIVREAVTAELDPAWRAAHVQRARMVMPRGSAGEPVRLW